MAARTRALAILLPPSEGKAAGGDGPGWVPASGRFAALGPQRTAVVKALAKAKGGDQKLLGVGGNHLARGRAANTALAKGAPTMPASARYTGVVYDHIDLASLRPSARKAATESIVVFSGLLGVCGIDDPIPDYRLKMGARLAPMGIMARWWKPTLSAALNEWLRGRVVIDLLPNDHATAWSPEPANYAAHVRVSFVEGSGSNAGAVIGHDAKAAKGLLVRHLLERGGDAERALASFEHDRFALRY